MSDMRLPSKHTCLPEKTTKPHRAILKGLAETELSLQGLTRFLSELLLNEVPARSSVLDLRTFDGNVAHFEATFREKNVVVLEKNIDGRDRYDRSSKEDEFSQFEPCVSTEETNAGIFHKKIAYGKHEFGRIEIRAIAGQDFTNENRKTLDDLLDQFGFLFHHSMKLEEAQDLALRDELTGLYNRRYLWQIMEKRFLHETRPVSLLLLDVDHFKTFNDTWGHATGDRVLKRLSGLMQSLFRSRDVICRYGGEEFAVLLAGPNSDSSKSHSKEVCQYAERLRQATELLEISSKKGENISSLTISGGIASYPQDTDSATELIEKADQALYHAKRSGRNRICRIGHNGHLEVLHIQKRKKVISNTGVPLFPKEKYWNHSEPDLAAADSDAAEKNPQMRNEQQENEKDFDDPESIHFEIESDISDSSIALQELSSFLNVAGLNSEIRKKNALSKKGANFSQRESNRLAGSHRILIVDDQESIHEDLRKVLNCGLESTDRLASAEADLFGNAEDDLAPKTTYEIDSAFQGAEGAKLVRQAKRNGCPYHVAFVDMRMPPGWDGVETIRRIWQEDPELEVVLCTAYSGYSWSEIAKKLDHSERLMIISKPFEPAKIRQMVSSLSEKWNRGRESIRKERRLLESQAIRQQLEGEIRQQAAEVWQREEEIAYRLVSAAEFRDNETGFHIRRIGMYSALLANAVGWAPKSVDTIRLAATMHDVGKIGVSDEILLKPGKLSEEEKMIMRQHTHIGAKILGGSKTPLLQMAEEIARCHHEHWDGGGYPCGSKGEQIPESARIVAIVDVYDALVHQRIYKKAFSEEATIDTMSKEKGKHFDPRIFEYFLQVVPHFLSIRQQVTDDHCAA